MRRELQAYLDGELRREDLPADLRETAERWDALLAAAAASAPSSAPAWLEAGVMRELRRAPAARRLPAWLEWLLSPRTVRVRPAVAAAALALLALVAVRPWAGGGADAGGEDPAAGPVVYVQFLVEAPGASSVALAGDFSAWQPTIHLDDPEKDGVWSARVPLSPGVHQYMFVVDGRRWITDPHAGRYADDGFGNRNAVVAVATPGAGT